MSNTEHWLATNGKDIWPMKHEGDYNDGDTLIKTEIDDKGDVKVVLIPTASPLKSITFSTITASPEQT